METTVRKRTWVKDAAIVFLAILLILTFFSRTILNASLTEVATQEIKSGPITAKVRGTGKVAANGSNKVKAKSTVTVAKVMVKTGEEVSVGDVLFILGPGDSAELEAAKNTLFDLEAAYDAAVANLPLSDSYASEQAAINSAQRELELAQENLRIAQSSYSNVDDDSQKNEMLQRAQKLEKEIAESTQKYEVLNSEYTKLKSTISERESYYEYIKNAYESQNAAAISASSLSTAQQSYDLTVKNCENAAKALEQAQLDGTEDEIKAAEKLLEECDSRKDAAEMNLKAAQATYDSVLANPAVNGIIEDDVAKAKALLEQAQNEYKLWCAAETEDKGFEYLNALKETVENKNSELKAVSAWLEVWNTGSGYNMTIRKAEAELAKARDNLYVSQSNLQKAIASDGKKANSAYLNVEVAAAKVERQKEKIKELAGEGEEKTITAASAGTVTEVNCASGDIVAKDDILAVIEVKDMGYTVSFSVTNEQARRLRTGDEGSISNFYRGNEIKAKLVSIATDKTDPQNKKVLTFDLEGNVSAGSEITVSVGQKSANYDVVVPNSAIRNDNNGSFVLMLTSKNSPLGNKYVARRVKVEVIAEDDNNSAVTGELKAGDFVITTSAAPISSGEQVRLADSAG